MIKFYRDLSICYLLAFLLGLPAVLLYFDHFKINFLIILFLGGVYLYIVSSLFTAIASKRLHKLVYELYFDCKIKEYIEESNKRMKM